MSKLIQNLIVVLAIIAFATSCQYKFIVEPVPPPPAPGDTTSFSLDVVPVWNNGNNCTSCHSTGGQKPDLTPDNAYNSIMSMGLVDTANPELSIIYVHPNANNTASHNWKKYTNTEAATVLQWIEEGAKNN